MTALEHSSDLEQVQLLADRQLRYEQRFFDSLNKIFIRLENISAYNQSLQLCLDECRLLKLAHLEECSALKVEYSTLTISHQEELGALKLSRQEECSALMSAHQEECSALKSAHQEECSALKSAHQEKCSALKLAYQAELATFAETNRLQSLGLEQFQEELSQQSHLLVNSQAELIYLRSRRPKAILMRLLERFGFLLIPLMPVSFLRRSKRAVIAKLKLKN